MIKITAFFLLILTASACKSEKERAILGKWNAAKLTECDEIIPIANTLVNIEFKSNGRYIFNSTLDVHEEGTYKIKKNYLYTLDEVREKATEKIVLIKRISADTLVLEMNYKGKEQWLTLIKDNTREGDIINEKGKEVQTPTTDELPAEKVSISQPASKESIAADENNLKTPLKEVKPEEAQTTAEKVVEKDDSEPRTAVEAYKIREAKRKAADAEIKRKEREIREAYLEREAQRKKQKLNAKEKSKK